MLNFLARFMQYAYFVEGNLEDILPAVLQYFFFPLQAIAKLCIKTKTAFLTGNIMSHTS